VDGAFSRESDERSFYTVDLIDEVLEAAAPNAACHLRLRAGFARMLAFDALLGAHDRHASNWGIVQDVRRAREPRFSPVFDTARGLFLDRTDDDLRRDAGPNTAAAYVERYAERSRPLIGVPGSPDLNHFALIQYMVGPEQAKFGASIRQVVHAFAPERAARLMHGQFGRLLSPVRLRLIHALLLYRWNRLKGICQGSTGR
jgi:hypothetical protein